MSEISVSALEKMIEEAFALRDEYQQAKTVADELFARYRDQQEKVVTELEALGLDSYKSKHGHFNFRYVSSFKTPKTPEDKQLFYNYLRSQGIFEDMISVNSKTLNSYCKQEEMAHPEILDFKIPGIEKGDPEPVVSMRRS